MKMRLCPKCETEMQATHQPYEQRCPECGFWYDTYTGKPVILTGEGAEVIENISYDGNKYQITGHRLGMTVDMCHEPRMTVLIIGFNRENRWWLGRYIVPKGMKTVTVLTEDFLDYVEKH